MKWLTHLSVETYVVSPDTDHMQLAIIFQVYKH